MGPRSILRRVIGPNPFPRLDIELFTSSTPNGHKVSIALEELGVPYKTTLVNLSQKEQFEPWFTQFCPNSKIPAVVNHADDGRCIMESGAILLCATTRRAHAHHTTPLAATNPRDQVGAHGPFQARTNRSVQRQRGARGLAAGTWRSRRASCSRRTRRAAGRQSSG